MQSNSNLFKYSTAYRPFLYSWAVDIAVAHEKIHWVEQEVTLEDDIADWKRGKMGESDKNFVTQILRMFTHSDVSVGRYYYDNLIPLFKNNEIRNMLGSFAAREAIHQRAYALLNDSLGLPESDYSAFLDYEEMADKANFMLEADPSTQKGLGLALAKSVFNEGVSLFASFVMLLNYQRNGLMKGMGKVVEWSIRDESMHVEGISQLFRVYCQDHPRIVNDEFKKAIYDMARIIVELEDKFIDLAYEMGDVKGLTKDEVKEYIRYIADRRLVQLGLKPNFNVEKNPLPWLDFILNGADHTNFFEGRVTSYEVGGLIGSWDYTSYSIIETSPIPMKIEVYSKPNCPYCDKAKKVFKDRNLEYKELDAVDNLDEMINRVISQTGGTPKTVPQIFIDGKYVGGYSELYALVTSGDERFKLFR